MAIFAEISTHEIFGAIRLDAEFYQPKYQDNEILVRRFPRTITLGRIAPTFVKGIFDISAEEYAKEGVPFVRINNLKNCAIQDDKIAFITPERHTQESKTAVKMYDLILSKTAYPAAALVQLEECNTSQDTIVVRTNQSKDFNAYLAVYLNTRFGLLQMQRLFQGNIQSHLSLDEARTITIPIPDEDFQSEIHRRLKESISQREHSKSLYANAENLLLHELRLDALDLSHELTYERNFSEIAAVGRYDAQYFHPEKQQVLEQLAKLPGKSIGSYFTSIDDLLAPPSEDTGELVQNYDLTEALRFFLDDIETTNTFNLGSAKKRFQRRDVAVSRLRSYLKEIALVETSPAANCVGSSEFIVLRPVGSEVSSELLVVYLRSLPVQKILKWCQDGSNHPRFKEQELLSIKLPDRILKVHDEVTRIIRTAIQSYNDAKQLLEDAKRQVEQMILGGESSHVA